MDAELLGKSPTVRMPANELRIALQSILGFTQLIELTGDNLTPVQLRHLASVESAAAQLLAYASADRLRPGPLRFEQVVIDIDRALAAALAALEAEARTRGVTLTARPSGVTVLGDREQLHQLLLNLLGCAVRSTPPGRTVRLLAHRLGEGVQLSIGETGIAIPRQLTMARRLAEMLGGELEWWHDADERTSITIRLPAAGLL